MKGLCIAVLLSGLAAACGGPTPTAPTPVPARAIVALDSWSYVSCLSAIECQIGVTVRNDGPDCASTVRGTLHIRTIDTNAFVADVQFNVPTGVSMRAHETYHMMSIYVQLASSARSQATMDLSSTPVRCT